MNFLQIDHRAFWGAFAIHMWQSALVVAVLLLLDRLLRGAPARLFFFSAATSGGSGC